MQVAANIKSIVTGVFIVGALLLTILTMFPAELNFGNWLSQRAVYVMFGLLAIGLLGLIFNQSKMLYVGMICCGILSLFLKGESNGSIVFPSKNDETSFSVLHLNLSSLSDDYEGIFKQIQEYDADIISFQEVTPDWDLFLKKRLKEIYTYNITIVKIDPYGKAIYSKYPLQNMQKLHSVEQPLLSLTLFHNNRNVRLISSYLSQAVDKKGLRTAQETLTSLTEAVNKSDLPTIVMGDFNLVYWSNEIRTFRDNTELNNSRRTISLSSFHIPFDHIFYSDKLECTSFSEVSYEGSHLGILGTYQVSFVN